MCGRADCVHPLPAFNQRVCTTHLKVKTNFRFLYDTYGHDIEISTAMGFRADELRRVARANMRNAEFEARLQAGKHPLKWTGRCVMPLNEAKINKFMVLDFWRERARKLELSFDLADPSIQVSNCVGCFFSSDGEQLRVAREEKTFLREWIRIEDANNAARPMPRYQPKLKVKAWCHKFLRREPTEQETLTWSCNTATWRMIEEAARKNPPTSETQESLGLTYEAGGCEDGMCGLDI